MRRLGKRCFSSLQISGLAIVQTPKPARVRCELARGSGTPGCDPAERLPHPESNEVFSSQPMAFSKNQGRQLMLLRLCFVLTFFATIFGVPISVHAGDLNQDDAAIRAMKRIAETASKCERVEIVAHSGKKNWYKDFFGPPTQVDFDVEKTASIVTPYRGILKFRLPIGGTTKDHHTKEEAEKDNDLRLLFVAQHQISYKINPHQILMDSRSSLNVISGKWETEAVHSGTPAAGFCWNRICADGCDLEIAEPAAKRDTEN